MNFNWTNLNERIFQAIAGFACRKLYLALLIFFTVSTQNLMAQQGTLTGGVFEAESHSPLPYANIIVEGTKRGTYSGSDGSYSIKLDTGLVTIRYRFLSFRDTVLTLRISEGQMMQKNVYLTPDPMSLDMTVSADRVARKVQQLARMRDQQNSNLRNYKAQVYKLAILSKVDKKFSYKEMDKEDLEPMAFSERKSEFSYTASPERYSEVLKANRASENFFSEYDFFSTGGEPLNLNSNEVTLSILSEDITVAGPISRNAGRYYELYDQEADSTWREGVIEIYFEPKQNNRPLFEGKVWYDEENSVILGVDVTLNDYTDTNTGTFKISDFRYQQSYKKVDDFWLPEKTKLSAMLKFFTSKDPIFYHDVWTWTNFQVNTSKIETDKIKLNTIQISPNAHTKSPVFWDTLSFKNANDNSELLDDAREYEEDRATVRLGMSAMRSFFRLPYQLERFYLTNFSDVYHYNRVEGHYLGLGIRTPVHPDFDYRVKAGYGLGNESVSYKLTGYHFFGDVFAAPEGSYYKETVAQYQDYEYNRTPLDFFETRQTLNALTTGTSGNNYFEREGFDAGLRFRFGTESFFRVLYMNENHNLLTTSSDFTLLGNELSQAGRVNNHPLFPTREGEFKGLYVHLHHDTRQYMQTQFLRDYNIREFGWLVDGVLEKGINSWTSDFDYNRYRIGLKFYWPVFASHFFQTDIILGASDSGIPNQRLFTYNGYVVDDYVRYRPFNTVDYREPLGNRVSQLKIRYKFGSSLTRSIPIEFISKSGIQISTLFTVGTIDQKPSLEPLLPYSDSKTQAEFGIAATKIFGIFYAEFSKRLYGEYGNTIGFTVLF